MGNYHNVGNYKPEVSASALYVKLGETKLGSTGANIEITGLSIDLDPNVSIYSKLVAVLSIKGDASRILTGTINGGTSFSGNYSTIDGGTETTASFSATSTFPIGNNAVTRGSLFIDIGYLNLNGETIAGDWSQGSSDSHFSDGGFTLITTKSKTFTAIKIISDASDLESGTRLTLYGLKV